MSKEPENLVVELLRGIRADVAGVKADLVETRAELKSDKHSLRADVASDLMVHRKEFGEQIVGLRRAVVEYHSAVIGHGMIIGELEARVRRMEQHLNLPSMGAH